MSDQLLIDRDGAVLTVTFNRPDQHNSMTWTMYDGLVEACEQADTDDDVRVMVLRGAGGRSFIAGTDIGQFSEFSSGDDGVAYEERIGKVLARLETVKVPTVAAVTGYCVGGGLAIASVCDIRIATPGSKFGVPIARTLGNCLSMNTHSLLVHHLGPARTLDLVLRARMIEASDAHAAGFVAEICEPDEIDERLAEVTAQLATHAPLTMWATKESIRRIRLASLPDGDDIVRTVFGSEDFGRGVEAFLAKRSAEWTGR